MIFQPNKLLYVVDPGSVAEFSDLQNELLESLTSIAEGLEGLKTVIESLDVPEHGSILGERSACSRVSRIDDPF